MNILQAQEMRQTQKKLLKTHLFNPEILKLPKSSALTSSQPCLSFIPLASQTTLQQIRKTLSLVDTIYSLPLIDPNSVLKVFTMTTLMILYKDKSRNSQGSDISFLQAIKCSLYSPSINFSNIKSSQTSINSQDLKCAMAKFFAFMSEQQCNFSAQAFKTAQNVIRQNENILNTFILLFRCILCALQVEGSQSWKIPMNASSVLQNLLDYFDMNYRQLGDLFLLYQQGILIYVGQNDIAYGEYFQNQREKENQQKQMEIKSSVKLNMVESFLLNVNQADKPNKKKNAIVDSDMKLFNFMLQSSQEEEEEEEKVRPREDMETPHFRENENFNFGKKRKSQKGNPGYKPQQVRFELQKLIKDESLDEISPDDLQTFNAQFEQALTPFLGGTISQNFAQTNNKTLGSGFQSPASQKQRTISNKVYPQHRNIINHVKNRMSMADHATNMHINYNNTTQNRSQKAVTEVSSNQNHILNSAHKNYNQSNLQSCICRSIRMGKNQCISKIVDFVYTPMGSMRRYQRPPNLSQKQGTSKSINRIGKQQKGYEINKQPQAKQRRYEDRTPSFLKNLKKGNSNSANPFKEQPSPTIKTIQYQQGDSRERKSSDPIENILKRQTNMLASQNFNNFPKFRDTEGINRMKLSDNQQFPNKKFDLCSGLSRSPAHATPAWQTTSNFHGRQMTSPGLGLGLGQPKATQINHPLPQSKNPSPLKFFAPVQIIAPTVYLNSNGGESNSNIVFKLAEVHQNSPKFIKGQLNTPTSPKMNLYRQSGNQQ